MQELIQNRRSEASKSERYDLFSLLLDANQQETENNMKLSDSELMGTPNELREIAITHVLQETSTCFCSLVMRYVISTVGCRTLTDSSE